MLIWSTERSVQCWFCPNLKRAFKKKKAATLQAQTYPFPAIFQQSSTRKINLMLWELLAPWKVLEGGFGPLFCSHNVIKSLRGPPIAFFFYWSYCPTPAVLRCFHWRVLPTARHSPLPRTIKDLTRWTMEAFHHLCWNPGLLTSWK